MDKKKKDVRKPKKGQPDVKVKIEIFKRPQ